MKYPFFILNPKAGSGKLKYDWPKLQKKAETLFKNVNFAWTQGPGDGTRLTREALKQGADGIFAVGGDGTLNECLNGFIKEDQLVNFQSVLGFLPYGRGSDFAKTLKIQKNWLVNLDRLKPNLLKLDCGKAIFYDENKKLKTRYFMNIANVGLAANIVDHAQCGVRIFGSSVNYLLATIKAMATSQAVPVKVTEGNKQFETRLLNGILANGQYFGSGMQPAPEALPDDGFLNWIEIGSVGFLSFLRHVSDLYVGRWDTIPQVRTARVSSIEVVPATKASLRVEMDGDTVGFAPVKFQVLRQIVPFWIPMIQTK